MAEKEKNRISLIDGMGNSLLASIVQSVDDPTKNGIVVLNADGTPIDGGGGDPVTLADVSTNSTDATKSTYTMTSTVPVEFESSDGNTMLYLDETNERIGVGMATPTAKLDVRGTVASGVYNQMTVNGGVITSNFAANSDTLAVYESHSHTNTAGNGAFFYSARSRGTNASPTVVSSGDTIGALAFVGYDGTDYATSSAIYATVDGTPGKNDMPGALTFYTSPDGSQTLTERIKISSTGRVTFSGNIVFTNNAITAVGNAATVPITSRISTVTNNSAATLTITMTTTNAVDGMMIEVRVLDFSAAAQTITWVNTENSTVSAPTTSNGSTTLPLSVLFQYNSATSKRRCLASA